MREGYEKKLIVLVGESKYEITARRENNKWVFTINDKEFRVDVASLKEGTYSLIIDGHSEEADVEELGENEFYVHLSNQSVRVKVYDRELFMARERVEGERKAGEEVVKSPMPGKVVKILVNENEQVKKHQPLLTMEAMKMENEIRSPVDGIIKKIYVKEGDVIEGNVNLILLTGI